jgi:hypothetical protein
MQRTCKGKAQETERTREAGNEAGQHASALWIVVAAWMQRDRGHVRNPPAGRRQSKTFCALGPCCADMALQGCGAVMSGTSTMFGMYDP